MEARSKRTAIQTTHSDLVEQLRMAICAAIQRFSHSRRRGLKLSVSRAFLFDAPRSFV
jgi:hypothetical protein